MVMMLSSPSVLSFALILSLPLLLLVGPRVLQPHRNNLLITLPDELDDLALFRRAISVSARSNSSTLHHLHKRRKRKIAFMFLTNSDLHFAPLWDRFFQGQGPELFNIYIHADPSAPFNPPSYDGTVFSGRLIPTAKRTQRSSPTLISAERRLLATALLDDPLNAFFALLSQHCIPLRPFHSLYHALFNHEHEQRSFIEILDGEPSLWSRYIARGQGVMLPEVPFSEFRVGSQFFVLSRRHALLVIQDRRLWRKFRLPCFNRNSCYPEEHYFPTLLWMRDLEGCFPFTLTHVNWTGSTNGHPYTYRPHELSPGLIRTIRSPPPNSTTKDHRHGFPYFFARKFSPDCLQPFLDMADSCLFRD
ncbi:hypothetical protein AMTRI_Chr03g56600 [Amborella trichopoda]